MTICVCSRLEHTTCRILQIAQNKSRIFTIIIVFVLDDTVFMADEAWREEYILNGKGMIWVDSARGNTGLPWNFGQVYLALSANVVCRR